MDMLTTEIPPTQPIKQPPFTPVPPRTKAIIYVMIFIGILLIFLVTPVPYYQSEEVYCKPGQMNCPGIGWHWNKTLYQSFQGFLLSSPRSQSIRVDTPQSTLLPTTEVTPEPIGSATTANWKIYTNTKYNYSISFPNDFGTQVNAAGAGEQNATSNSDQIFLFKQSAKEPYLERYLEIVPIGQVVDLPPGQWQKVDVKINGITAVKFESNDPQTFIVYRLAIPNSLGELEIYITKDIQKVTIANQILSTFKFLEASPSPITSYLIPSGWKRSTTPAGLNLCLPPKWELGPLGVIFNRDPGYITPATNLIDIPYSGGSTREAYFKYWEKEYPNVRNLVRFVDTNINGNSALTIYPTDDEAKTSPDGLAVIWYATGKLRKAEVSGWSMVNDSQAAFLKDLYTMISCSY